MRQHAHGVIAYCAVDQYYLTTPFLGTRLQSSALLTRLPDKYSPRSYPTPAVCRNLAQRTSPSRRTYRRGTGPSPRDVSFPTVADKLDNFCATYPYCLSSTNGPEALTVVASRRGRLKSNKFSRSLFLNTSLADYAMSLPLSKYEVVFEQQRSSYGA